MNLSLNVLQFHWVLLLVLNVNVRGNGIKIETRGDNQGRSIGVSKRELPSFSSWLPNRKIGYHPLAFDGASVWTSDIRKQEALVHPNSGQVIRLRSPGKSTNSGIVEVYKAGKWGYVCEDGWNLIDASVVCREIGFTRGAISASNKNSTLRDVQRSTDSIVINDLQCSGTEKSLLDCPHSLLNDCSREEIATVECSEDIKCPKHWRLGLNKCYKFYTKANTVEQASNICAKDNASLVVIDSVEENHFLSNLLHTSLPNVHQWYTGGIKSYHVWQWKRTVPVYDGETLDSENRNKTTKSVLMDLQFTKWFPGWPSNGSIYAEPRSREKYDCLTLSNVYKDPFNKTSTLVDYFYWKADKCTAPDGLHFICQMNAREEESNARENCYTGDGSTYRGTAAVTEDGQPCQKWSLSSEINHETHKKKGLGDHNFCRNPDDSSQPWCWVDHRLGTFGVCKLPKCSSDEDEISTLRLHSANVTFSLVESSDKGEGNLEAVIDNQRYRVCDDKWNNKDAAVVCRMMGYSAGGTASTSSFFGNETASIVIDDVDCNGTETHFNQCSVSMDVVQRNCEGQQYAGVICAKENWEEPEGDATYRFDGKCGRRPFDFTTFLQTREEEQSDSLDDEVSDIRPSPLPNQVRIIGGHFVQHGSYPWQVRFQLLLRPYSETGVMFGYHHCGGAIVSEYWMISAAHCFHNEKLDRMVATVGEHDQTVKDLGEQAFAIEKVIIHEQYNEESKDYDMALVKIKPTKDGKGIQFNKYVQPVCLPSAREFLRNGMICTVAGWGYLNKRTPGDNNVPSNGYPNILKAIAIPVINSRLCLQLYKEFNKNYNKQTMLCAGNLTGGTDSCDGDSGGPLVCKIAGAYTAVGITSWGRGCALQNMPGVYARVSTFVDWIREMVSLNSKSIQEETFPTRP